MSKVLNGSRKTTPATVNGFIKALQTEASIGDTACTVLQRYKADRYNR